jgi:hypothetical protein
MAASLAARSFWDEIGRFLDARLSVWSSYRSWRSGALGFHAAPTNVVHLADLKIEKATVEGEHRTVEADLGPVRYLSLLIGTRDDDVLQWFILAVALLLEPAAVLLLLAAAVRPRRLAITYVVGPVYRRPVFAMRRANSIASISG